MKNGGADKLPFLIPTTDNTTGQEKRQLMKGVPLFLLPHDRGTAAERRQQPMKAIILKAGKNARVANIDPTYKNLSSLVGGRLEMTYPFEDEYIAVVCNEEAILFDLPPTRVARRADGSVAEIYCGTLVVLALAPEGEFRSLTDEEEELILSVWGKPDEHIRWGFISQEGGMQA